MKKNSLLRYHYEFISGRVVEKYLVFLIFLYCFWQEWDLNDIYILYIYIYIYI